MELFCKMQYWIPSILAPKIDEPECRVDADCPTKLACIGERCQNPCRVNNPCVGSQRCEVQDSLPTRTVACVCPDGQVFGNRGECKSGNLKKGLLNTPTKYFQNNSGMHEKTDNNSQNHV